jgi:hypothetical protein
VERLAGLAVELLRAQAKPSGSEENEENEENEEVKKGGANGELKEKK